MKEFARSSYVSFGAIVLLAITAGAQTLKPTSLSFGNQVLNTASAPATVTLTNNQSVALVISSIAGSGDFAANSNCPISPSGLAPGASCALSVTFTPSAVVTRTGTLTIADNGATSSQTVSLSGNGIAPVALSATSLWMGSQAIGTTSPAKTVTLTNNQTVPLTIGSIGTTGDYAQTNNCPATLGSKSSCSISISLTPTTSGTRNGTLTVSDDAVTSPQSVALTGTGLVPVALSNTVFTFGNQVVNTTSATVNATLTNNLPTTLSINSITSSLADFGVSTNCPLAPASLSAGGKCTVSVNFTPLALGSRVGTLSIVDNATTSPQTAKLSGTGTLTGLSSIVMNPPNATMVTGTQQQFAAIGNFTNGTSQDISKYVTWASSNRAVATVAAGGAVSAIASGSTTISAKYSTIVGSTTLTVGAAARTLQSITVTPTSASIAKGQTQQLNALATYSDGSTQDITSTVTWSSSVPSTASINNAGLASGVGAGSTVISATSGLTTGSTTLTVSSAALVSIALSPANSSVALGTTQQFTATGTYTDGSTLDITKTATWTSSQPSVAAISNAAPTQGLATSASLGQTTVTAALGAVTGSTNLTVTPAALVSIAITPAVPTVSLGVTQQFTATGKYTDGSTQTITTSVQWSSSNTAVATITNATGSQGLATTVAAGTTSISATSGGISSSTDLTVTPATLVSLAVTPANPSIALGTSQQFTAVGTFSDNTTKDLTSTASWSSDDLAVATINASGFASTVASGTANITASVNGTTGATQLTVTPAALSSITVSPGSATIANGTTQQFRATGQFTDGTVQDVTSTVQWSSSSAQVATISNTTGTNGLATSVAPGTATISATSGSISGTASLVVNPAPMVSISVTPQNASIALGTQSQFTATASYADGTSQDVTNTVQWASSDTTVATITNAGLATSSGVGSATITATSGSVSGSATVTVQGASLVSLSVAPQNPSVATGGTQQFTASGTYSDGTTQDITASATWTSSSGAATISTTGLATGVAAGTSTITAALGSVSGSTTLNVLTPGPVLTSIAISPTNGSTALGAQQQFTATGTYSDASTADLTTSVVWNSSVPSVLSISNNPGSNGQGTTVAVGQTNITATLGNITGSTTFTVSPGLMALTVSCSNSVAAVGSLVQLTAKGTYSDGSQQDLTGSVTWSSSNPAVATVSATGAVSGLASGQATITATNGNTSSSTTVAFSPMRFQAYTNPPWDGPVSAIVTAANGDTLLGANGTGVYKSSDGHNWTLMGAPTEPGIESLLWYGTSLYAGTHNGVFVSSDEGATWTRFGSGLNQGTTVFALAAFNGSIYAATDRGLVYKSGGSNTWTTALNGNEFRALFLTSSGLLLAGTTSGGNGGGPGGDIYKSTDGVTWTKQGIANAWSFRSFGEDANGTLYAGAFYKGLAPGGLYTSTDGGSTWSGPALGTYSVQTISVAGSTVYLGTREGVLFAGPQAWQQIPNPSGKAILSLSYPFLGSDGIYRMDDNTHPTLGSAPEVTQLLQDKNGTTYWRSSYFGIWSSTEGYIGPTGVEAAWHLDNLMFLNAAGELVAFDQASIYHRLNRQWIKATLAGNSVYGRFYCYVVLPDGSILVGDVNDRLWKSTDGGSSFTYLTTRAGASGVTFDLSYAGGVLYGASELSNIISSTDGGKTWTALPQFLTGAHNVNTYAVTTSAAGTLLAGRAGGNADGCVFRYVSGAWQRSDQGIPSGYTVYHLYAMPVAVYALTDHGVYQSVNDGQSWALLSAPIFASSYTAEFRPTTITSTPDGHLIIGLHWEGRGAYISMP